MIKTGKNPKPALLKQITLFTLIIALGNNLTNVFSRFRVSPESEPGPKLLMKKNNQKKQQLAKKRDLSYTRAPLQSGKKIKYSFGIKKQQSDNSATIATEALPDWKVTTTADFYATLGQIEELMLGGEPDEDTKKKFVSGFAKQRQRFHKAITQAKEEKELAPLTTPFQSIWESYKVAQPYFEQISKENNLTVEQYKLALSELTSQIYANISEKSRQANTSTEKIVLTQQECTDLVDHVILQKPLPEIKLSTLQKPPVVPGLQEKLQHTLELEVSVAKLTAEIKDFEKKQKELAKLKKALAEEESKHKLENQQLTQIKTEKGILQQKMLQTEAASKKQIEDEKDKDAALEKKIDELSSQLANTNKQMKDAFDEKISLQVSLEKKTREAATAKDQATTNEGQLREAEVKARRIEQSLKNALEDRLSSQIKNKQLEMEKLFLDKKNIELQDTLSSKDREISGLQDKMKNNADNLSQAKTESRELREQIEKLKNESSDFNSKIRALDKDLQSRTQESLTAQIRMNRALQERETLIKKQQELLEEKDILEREKKHLKIDLFGQIEKISKKDKEVSKLEQKQNKLKNKLEQLKEKIAALTTPSSKKNQEQAQEEAELLTKKMADLSQKINQTQDDLKKSNVAKDELSKALNALKTEESLKDKILEGVSQNQAKTANQIETFDKRLQDKEVTLSQHLSEKDKLESQLNDQKAAAKAKDEHLKTLEALAKAGSEKIGNLNSVGDALRQTAATLEKEITQVKNSSEEKREPNLLTENHENSSTPPATSTLPPLPPVPDQKNLSLSRANIARPTPVRLLLPKLSALPK